VSDAGLGVVHEEVGDGPVEDKFSQMVQCNLVAEVGRKAAVGFMHSCNLRWHTWLPVHTQVADMLMLSENPFFVLEIQLFVQ